MESSLIKKTPVSRAENTSATLLEGIGGKIIPLSALELLRKDLVQRIKDSTMRYKLAQGRIRQVLDARTRSSRGRLKISLPLDELVVHQEIVSLRAIASKELQVLVPLLRRTNVVVQHVILGVPDRAWSVRDVQRKAMGYMLPFAASKFSYGYIFHSVVMDLAKNHPDVIVGMATVQPAVPAPTAPPIGLTLVQRLQLFNRIAAKVRMSDSESKALAAAFLS